MVLPTRRIACSTLLETESMERRDPYFQTSLFNVPLIITRKVQPIFSRMDHHHVSLFQHNAEIIHVMLDYAFSVNVVDLARVLPHAARHHMSCKADPESCHMLVLHAAHSLGMRHHLCMSRCVRSSLLLPRFICKLGKLTRYVKSPCTGRHPTGAHRHFVVRSGLSRIIADSDTFSLSRMNRRGSDCVNPAVLHGGSSCDVPSLIV